MSQKTRIFIVGAFLYVPAVPVLAQNVTGSTGYFAGSGSLIQDNNVPLQTNALTVTNGIGEGYVGINKGGGYGLLLGYKNDSIKGDTSGGAYIRQVTNEPMHIQVNNSTDAEVITSDGNVTFPGKVQLNGDVPRLVNDAAGSFTTQGNTLCNAPETGQASSNAGVCMQYTPDIPYQGGAAAIFALKGATSDYTSPALTISSTAGSGSTVITVTNDGSIANVANNYSVITSSVSGAMQSGTIINRTQIGATTTTFTLTKSLTAAIPLGSTVAFTTPTSTQQFTALAGSADLTAHQNISGQAWAANFIVQAEAGSSGKINGMEIDTANFSSFIGQYGIWLANNGNNNMGIGYLLSNGANQKGFNYGFESDSSSIDDFISSTRSKATYAYEDDGTHTSGSFYRGSYSSNIIQAINPSASTPSLIDLFEVTPQGGMVDGSPTPFAASSGFNLAATNGTTGIILVCNGTLASGAISLPTVALPKQVYHISSECSVTTLSLTVSTGTTIVGAATGITPSTPESFLFDNDRSIWVRWQ